MKVLYFIPKAKSDVFSFFRKELIESVGDMAEVHVVTPRTDEGMYLSGIKIHHLSAYPLMIRRNRRRFDKIAGDVNPDIIHILGSWNLTASYVEKWARIYRIPVVMSPLKGFAPWNMHSSYCFRLFPQMLLFQKSMLTHVHAIHAVGNQEKRFIEVASWHPLLHRRTPWNSRIAVIENPEFTDETDTTAVASAMIRLYNKVADSNPFMRMTDGDRKREGALLRVGLSRDAISSVVPDEARSLLVSMNDESWRRIFLHSMDESISDIVMRGVLSMQLNRKSIVIENEGRFENTRKKELASLRGMPALVKGRMLKNLESKYGQHKAEVEICTMTVNIFHMLKDGTLCRRHLAELYEAIRFEYYDENVVRLMLKRLNKTKPAARLMRIMGETMGLEEGFMPLEPVDDRGTDKIRKTLFKLKIQ